MTSTPHRNYRDPDYIDDENPDWKNDECPVCLEKYWLFNGTRYILVMPKDGIDNYEGYDTTCKHYICVNCVYNIHKLHPSNQRCPICREDWSEWIGDQEWRDDDDDLE